MTEASRMQVKVDIGQSNRPGPQKLVTLGRVVEWIRKQDFDEYTQNGLIDLAATYPTSALPSFRRNFNLMIQRVRAKRKKEQNGEDVNVEIKIKETIVDNRLSLEEALNQAFKPVVKEGPEFQVTRRPLFDEPEENVGDSSYEPVQFETWTPEEESSEDWTGEVDRISADEPVGGDSNAG